MGTLITIAIIFAVICAVFFLIVLAVTNSKRRAYQDDLDAMERYSLITYGDVEHEFRKAGE